MAAGEGGSWRRERLSPHRKDAEAEAVDGAEEHTAPWSRGALVPAHGPWDDGPGTYTHVHVCTVKAP